MQLVLVELQDRMDGNGGLTQVMYPRILFWGRSYLRASRRIVLRGGESPCPLALDELRARRSDLLQCVLIQKRL